MLTQPESIHLYNKYLETCSLLSTVRSAEDSIVNTQCASEIFFKGRESILKSDVQALSHGKEVEETNSHMYMFFIQFQGSCRKPKPIDIPR